MAAIISWTFSMIVEGSPNGGILLICILSVMMILAFIFIRKIMPETKGRSLEQIQKELGIK
jgi:hypothetical protein